MKKILRQCVGLFLAMGLLAGASASGLARVSLFMPDCYKTSPMPLNCPMLDAQEPPPEALQPQNALQALRDIAWTFSVKSQDLVMRVFWPMALLEHGQEVLRRKLVPKGRSPPPYSEFFLYSA